MLHKDNNLNLLRLIAAFMVLYAHSFAFYGNSPPVFLGLTSYGGLGIDIFFIISGYLIVKSWDSTPSAINFLSKRALRIFPALVVVVLMSMLVLGPIFTTLSIGEYFAHPQFLPHLKNIILSPVFYLPGVLEHARVPNAVNGSLWSLPVEFFMYVVVMGLGILFRSGRWVYAVATGLFMLVVIFWCWAGAPPTVIYGSGSWINRVGDCSYGVYIYAFPVQQFMLLKFPTVTYPVYLASTVVITLLLGYVSWHFIEKHALKFKPEDKSRRLEDVGESNTSLSPAIASGLDTMKSDGR